MRRILFFATVTSFFVSCSYGKQTDDLTGYVPEVVLELDNEKVEAESFQEDYVRYLTEAQFGFAAAVNGIMIRERPATNFFIGRFWAESLIMAETGAQTGAI